VLLDQLASQAPRLRREFRLDLRVRGVIGSQRMLLADSDITAGDWRAQYQNSSRPADLTRFIEHVRLDYLPHTVIVDCSASETVAAHYAAWLAAGIHVITPNKKANSGNLAYYHQLQSARRSGGSHYLYEATVGAGLPVVQTLRDLCQTGDAVTSIEGIFSGTLAYLFNVYDGRRGFAEIVHEARQRGFTEPDPRDDLSGMDVARKLIILGREMGLPLELKDVQVESLVPPELADESIADFMTRLPEHDAALAARLSGAHGRGKVLRYTGKLTAGGVASVGLQELEARHPFANIALTDNVVRFATRRYCDNPLIVQGPGAGPEVTAGGVFADLLRLAAYLGARL
jgi:aspartokinase/homoserine dehydrogenase 1